VGVLFAGQAMVSLLHRGVAEFPSEDAALAAVFRRALAEVAELIVIVDKDWAVLWFNDPAAARLALPRGAAERRAIADFLAFDPAVRHQTWDDGYVPRDLTVRATQEVITAEVALVRSRDHHHMVLFVRDVAEAAATAAALADLEARIAEIRAAVLPDGVRQLEFEIRDFLVCVVDAIAAHRAGMRTLREAVGRRADAIEGCARLRDVGLAAFVCFNFFGTSPSYPENVRVALAFCREIAREMEGVGVSVRCGLSFEARADAGVISETTLVFHIASGAIARAYALARNTEPGSLMLNPRATGFLTEEETGPVTRVQRAIGRGAMQNFDVLTL
jgi:PAS domain-containing protein